MREDAKAEVLGYVAGFLATFSFVPQVVSIWQMRPFPAVAISLWMYVIFSSGVFCWMLYGIWTKAKPIIIWNLATFILAASVLSYKLIYG